LPLEGPVNAMELGQIMAPSARNSAFARHCRQEMDNCNFPGRALTPQE
jgi:hypothetical protein